MTSKYGLAILKKFLEPLELIYKLIIIPVSFYNNFLSNILYFGPSYFCGVKNLNWPGQARPSGKLFPLPEIKQDWLVTPRSLDPTLIYNT